jgi:tetratricopeptide (TPR) repeat protein
MGLAIILILVFIVPMNDEVWIGLGNALIALIAPASIMILAEFKSLMQAINPLQVIRYMVRIGYPYLALCFTLFFFTESAERLQGFFHEYVFSLLAHLLTSGANFYFAIVIFNMIGYVMFQYHEQLGIEVKMTHQEAEARHSPNTKPDPVTEKLNAMMASGNTVEALKFMRYQLRMRWEDNDLQWRYQRLLQATGKQQDASDHAREFITKLVNEKHYAQALNLYEHWFKADPEFRLQESDQVHDLASAAKASHRTELALSLLEDFEQHYPEHPHIQANYLLTAKILTESCRKDREALELLNRMVEKFPDHELTAEARQYMEVINKLAAIQ